MDFSVERDVRKHLKNVHNEEYNNMMTSLKNDHYVKLLQMSNMFNK